MISSGSMSSNTWLRLASSEAVLLLPAVTSAANGRPAICVAPNSAWQLLV